MNAANDAETAIRALLKQWQEAFRDRNAAAVMAVYAPEDQLVAFDVVPPLALLGRAAYRKSYEDFFAMFTGPLHVELRDVRIVAGGDVAFLHCFDHIAGTLQSGEDFGIWLRVTCGLRRVGGQWRIMHDHVSVPTNFETGMAVLDAVP